MLRNRSRAVTSSNKQALMADHSTSQISTAQNYTTPIPYLFDSSRFKLFTSKPMTEINSPTSILDSKPFFSFPFGNPFAFDVKSPKSPKFFSPNTSPETPLEPKGIALANQIEDERSSCVASNNRKVLFGTELRVQIPPSSPKSPADFGIKTGNSHSSPSPFGSPPLPVVVFNGSSCLPVRGMELSEDYTCVTSHGPNPKTTHIFDNCVLENYCSTANNTKPRSAPPESNFLSFCHTCKKNLEHKGIDIYIYRGEKAFCSQGCRYQEMILDGEEN